MTEHTHEMQSTVNFPSGTRIDVCECGATTRTYNRSEAPPKHWHTCVLCTHPWGLPKETK